MNDQATERLIALGKHLAVVVPVERLIEAQMAFDLHKFEARALARGTKDQVKLWRHDLNMARYAHFAQSRRCQHLERMLHWTELDIMAACGIMLHDARALIGRQDKP